MLRQRCSGAARPSVVSSNWMDSVMRRLRAENAGLKPGATSRRLSIYFVDSTLALLARLFRYGEISHHGAFVDVASSRVMPLAVDPLVWYRIRKRGRQNARSKGAAD